MKLRFWALTGAMALIIITIMVVIAINGQDVNNKINNKSDNLTPATTLSQIPTKSPVPVVGAEEDQGIYPFYQIIDHVPTYGYMNSKGETIINPAFTMANDFHNGHAVVYMGKQYLLVDTTGNILYTSNNTIRDFTNGASVMSKKSGKDILYGYVDVDGKEIIQARYKYASDFSKEHTAYVYHGDGLYSKINLTGKVLETYELNKKYNPIDIEDDYIIYYNTKDGSYGVINFKEEVIFKAVYSEIIYMGDDIFALKKPDHKVGTMTSALPAALYKSDGTQITDYTLYDIRPFYNGYATVTDSKYTYFIGTDGKEVSHLPKFEGRGTVTLYGNIIKAAIDRDLTYYKTDGTIIWQSETTQMLSGTLSVKRHKLKPNKYVTVYYPQLFGLPDDMLQTKINNSIKSKFADPRIHLKEKDFLSVEDTFKVTLKKNLLTIERDGYDYNFGAAHGMPIKDFYYVDMTDGTFHTFKDLFMEGSDYVNAINQFIKNEISADSSSDSNKYFQDGFKGIPSNPNFMITNRSVIIYFYPYEIAPFSSGFPKFEIPYEDIYNYINFNSAFWKSFN